MKTIFKYEFPIASDFSLEMPEGANVVSVQMQGETPCMWATVDNQAKPVRRAFSILGTGQSLPGLWEQGMRFIGTFQQPPFVWHLFEELPD